jgi:DNA-binding ferritin-like protein (Dps family)
MAANWIEKVVGPRGYKQYKVRTERLPPSYHAAIDALERYFNYCGGGSGESSMLADLADLFEESAANGTPIREVVGENPVEFAEAFLSNYPKGRWIIRERERLNNSICRAEDDELEDEGNGNPHDN